MMDFVMNSCISANNDTLWSDVLEGDQICEEDGNDPVTAAGVRVKKNYEPGIKLKF